jgi:hypothetical protein
LNVVRNVGAFAAIRTGADIRSSDDAANASPTSVDLGWIHCHSDLTDLDVIAVFYFRNDSGDQWPGLLGQVSFGIGDAGKLISIARHVLISKIDPRWGVHRNHEHAYLFYDVLYNDTMTVSGAKSRMALVQ